MTLRPSQGVGDFYRKNVGCDQFDEAEGRFLSNLKLAEENGLEHEATLARAAAQHL